MFGDVMLNNFVLTAKGKVKTNISISRKLHAIASDLQDVDTWMRCILHYNIQKILQLGIILYVFFK